MYLYLYDSFLNSPKYQKIVDKIESRLTDLGISGKVARLTIIKNTAEIIKDALRKDIQTIIVVGRDALFCEAASALVKQSAVLGFIPVGQSLLGKILGLSSEEFGCEVVSGRRIKLLDAGKINNQYFLSSVSVLEHKVDIRCEGSYKVNLVSVKNLKINNLDFFNDPKNNQPKISNPFDGLLEAVLSFKSKSFWPFSKRKEYQDSIFYIKKIAINSKKGEEIPILVDKERVLKTPAEIEVVPEAIKIIVGKERLV